MPSFALSLFIAAAATTSTVPAGTPEGAFDPPPSIRHQLEEAASKQAAYEAQMLTRDHSVKNWASELPPNTFDVTAYELDLHVDARNQILSGSVTVDFTAVEDGLSTVALDADLGLRILSVLQLGDERYPYDTPSELAFEHADDVLSIALAQPVPAGGKARLQVNYGGHAWRGGLIGTTGVNWYNNGGTPVIHTFAQPYGARIWWPCNDRPDDKALVRLRVTVPDDLDVAANGLEESRNDNGDGTATSVWASKYPVPTYLVVMHISDFVYSESTYTGLDGTTMPIGLWAMPEVAAQAEADLAVCVPQMEVMAGHWGEYPFIDEKYGNATVFFGGGMEHQTMTTLSVYQVGDPWMQWLNVHEMGHQWWGDWVTMDDWRETWLNEGYATHTEWLWAEHLGPNVLADYLLDEDWRGWFSGPVFDNPEPFSWTIYAKGSWVVWMLRHVIGDDTFFDAMAAYRAANAGGTATSDDLRQAMEDASGMELDWFFDEWVYGLYRPRYIFDWSNTGSSTLELTVRQVQNNTGLFRMPMNIRVTTSLGTEDHRVWLEAETEQTVEIQLQAQATDVVMNPETHVLCEIAHVSEPDLELGADFPEGYDFGVLPGSAQATKSLPLTNVGGADLVIGGIVFQSHTEFDLVDPPQFPLTIAPGQTHTVEVLANPSGNGLAADWMLIQSNDPDRDGLAYLPLSAIGSLYDDPLLAAPTSRSFGGVPLGGTDEVAFDVINLGGQPLAVTTSVEGEGFFLGGVVPKVLAPGTSYPVYVRFHPENLGSATGSVIFHAGNPADPIRTVRLSATGEGAPRLELSGPALSLGVGDLSSEATLLLSNSGSEPLVVSLLDIDSPFGLLDPPVGAFEIPAGAAEPLVVLLADTVEGLQSGTLTIHSNDPAIPVAKVPLRAEVSDDVVEASFPAAANGSGLGDTSWSTRAYFLNPTTEPLRADLFFRPRGERGVADGPDAGIEVPARSQRVLADLVAATGSAGTGGINMRTSNDGLIAISRTFASGAGGSYGQYIGADEHSRALASGGRYLFAGLSGNGGFRTNMGILNLSDEMLTVEFKFFNPAGEALGKKRITAQPRAFQQIVSILSKVTDEIIRGGYATFTTLESDVEYLAYGSVVDDASSDPTLVQAQELGTDTVGADLVVAAAASLPGRYGTTWRSQLDVVNMADETRNVTVEFVRSNGSSIVSMPHFVEAGVALRFDDVVGGLFGEGGKGWLRITSSGAGVHATTRTFNDDPAGTYGQRIPASRIDRAATRQGTAVLAGLSSMSGFRTNIGLTSLAAEDTNCTLAFFTSEGAVIGEIEVTLGAHSFVQIERVLSDEFSYVGEAWAEIDTDDISALYFAHASVVDGDTGDSTYIPAVFVTGS